MKYLIIFALLLAGCGHDILPPPPADQTIAVNAPDPFASPSPSPSASPSCKPVNSTWTTPNIPYDDPNSPGHQNPGLPHNVLMGYYAGPSTNAPQFTLDLSDLSPGANYASFNYDATHACYYDLTLDTSTYTVNYFRGCSQGVVPPGGTTPSCSYCPYYGSSSTYLGAIYSFTLGCNAVSITDMTSQQTLSYN